MMIGLGLGIGLSLSGGGQSIAPGYAFRTDELGVGIVDEFGVPRIGQTTPTATLIKTAAAARGIKFGAAVNMTDINADAPYKALVEAQCSILATSNGFTGNSFEQVQGVFTNTRPRAFVTYADSVGLPFRWPAGLIYPAHDMDWVSENDGTNINPVLDGNGDPNIRAATYAAEIDNFLNYLEGEEWVGRCTTINVSNELINPDEADGWRRHPWYNATSGPGWLEYLFDGVHTRWPNVPLGLCQDLTEQLGESGSYFHRLAWTFVDKLEDLLTAGVPISYVDLQGHMTIARGYNPVLHKEFLTAIRALGLDITVGELDIRTGDTGLFVPGSYTPYELDRQSSYMIEQYCDTTLPFVNGGALLTWGLSDKYNAWTATEPTGRPLPFATDFAAKPFANVLLEQMAWR
jgi:endo-1,4-beta-xylanase